MIYILLGVLFGILTGLLPGFHPNNLIPILEHLIYNKYHSLIIGVFALTINSFLSFIPTLIFGIPESGIEISVPAGQKLAQEGRGRIGIFYSAISGIFAMSFSIILIPIFSLIIKILYNLIIEKLYIFLSFFILFQIFRARDKLKTFLIILLAGILGILSLNSGIKNPIFPLLLGLFGTSSLIISLFGGGAKLPKQTEKFNINFRRITYLSFISVLLTMILELFPSLSPSMIIYILIPFFKLAALDIVTILGGITTADALFSVLSLYIVGNPRSGIAVFISRNFNLIDDEIFYLTLVSFISAAALAFLLTIILSDKIIKLIERANYRLLNLIILIFLVILLYFYSGLPGFLIVIPATALGIFCQIERVEKTNLIASLMIPIIWAQLSNILH